jgi:hypothetical protein
MQTCSHTNITLLISCVLPHLKLLISEYFIERELGSIGSTVTRLHTGWTTKKSWFSFWQGKRFFLFSEVSRPAVGPIQLSSQYVLEIFSHGWSSLDMKLITHLSVILMLEICGAVPALPIHTVKVCTGTILLKLYLIQNLQVYVIYQAPKICKLSS